MSTGLRSGMLLAISLAMFSLSAPVWCATASTDVELGRLLFEDKNLSADRSTACSSCHAEERAFSDGRSVSVGNRRRFGTRNAPSLLGVSDYRSLFWDGRADNLDTQAAFPLFSSVEMGLSGEAELLARVRENAGYVRAFERLKGVGADRLRASDITHALATYERSLRPDTTPLDEYLTGNKEALYPEAKAGFELFRGRAGCSGCHEIDGLKAPLTDNQFHESAVGNRATGSGFSARVLRLTHLPLEQRLDQVPRDPQVAALGRFVVTLDPKDIGAFRTPSLRSAAATAPYMHDGSIATLQEAVDLELYYRGLRQGYPVNLSLAERREIRLFIESASPSSHQPPHFHGALAARSPSVSANYSVSSHHE